MIFAVTALCGCGVFLNERAGPPGSRYPFP
jgi:hypothetical protein